MKTRFPTFVCLFVLLVLPRLFAEEEPDLVDQLVEIEQQRFETHNAIQKKYAKDCEAMLARQLEMLAEKRKTFIEAGDLDGVLAVRKTNEAVKKIQADLKMGISLPPWEEEDNTDVPENVVNYRNTTQQDIEKELQTSTETMFRKQLDALNPMIQSLTKREMIEEAVAVKKMRDAAQKDFDRYAQRPTRPFGWKGNIVRFPKEKKVEFFSQDQLQPRRDKIVALQLEEDFPARIIGCRDQTESGVLSDDGVYLLTGSNINDCASRLYELATQKLLGEMPGDGPVRDGAFHPELPLLFTTSMTPKIQVWNAGTFESHAEFSPMPQCNVMQIAIHKDGKFGIAGSDTGRLFAWDTETGKMIKEFEEGHTEEVRDIVFHPGGDFFATAGHEGNIFFWTMDDAKPTRSIPSAVTGDLFSIRFSPDGTKLAAASTWRDMYISIYDVQSGERVYNFGGYGPAVRAVCFSSDGRFLVTGDTDHRVVIWDIVTKEPLWSNARNPGNHIYQVIMTPNQDRLVVVSGAEPTIYTLPEKFAAQE